MGKREEGEGANLFVCEGPHSEELLPGQDELYAVLAFIDHPIETSRVAGLGRLSAGAKKAMKPFVKRVFTIFATNASFLRVISNLRI